MRLIGDDFPIFLLTGGALYAVFGWLLFAIYMGPILASANIISASDDFFPLGFLWGLLSFELTITFAYIIGRYWSQEEATIAKVIIDASEGTK